MTHHPDLKSLAEKIQQRTQEQHDNIIKFMREICAIPSMNSHIGPVGECIQAEMRKFGFDEVRFDDTSLAPGIFSRGWPGTYQV